MLCVNTYKNAYIDECRASMEAQLAAYRALLAAAKGNAGDRQANLQLCR